jgi:hypothetical protein
MDSSRPNTPGTTSEGGPDEQPENYITGVKKLAAIIGKTQQTALHYVQSGKIVAVPIGGTYRIYESELRRFLKYGNHPDPQPLKLHKRGPQGEPDDVNNDA